MRSGKSLLVLLAVLVGLGAYIYFVESRKPQGEAEDAKPKVFSVNADKIAEMEITARGEKTVLKKTGTGWQIEQPVAAKADAAEVSGITTNLATVENVRVVDEKPGDLAQYGLAQPRVDVAFKASGDKDFRHLLIGDKTATGGELYARLGNEKKVFLVPGFIETTFEKSTFDLRDKSILAFDRDKVDRLQLEWPGETVQLKLANGDWTLDKPLQAPADFGSVEAVVGRIQTAQMKSIVSQDASDLKQYGLDKPQVTAVLGMGSSQASLLLGKKADEATVYAKDAARPLVFTVEANLVDDLKKGPDQLRRKDLFTSRAFNTTAVEVQRGAETVAFEKAKGEGKDATDKWRERKPAAKDVDAAKLETFLTKLSNLRASSWVPGTAKTGLDAAAMVVTIRFEDGKREEKVSFGKVGANVYAAVAGQPGAAQVDATEFDDAMKALDAVK